MATRGLDEAGFSEPTAAWFRTTFGEATRAQAEAWPAIASGSHVLLCAPTGSGKTLAAFLSAIDALATAPIRLDEKGNVVESTTVLYISPLRALAVDVEKNLRAPIRVDARRPAVGDGSVVG